MAMKDTARCLRSFERREQYKRSTRQQEFLIWSRDFKGKNVFILSIYLSYSNNI